MNTTQYLLGLPGSLTRAEYETAAEQLGVATAEDSEMGDYGDQFGDYFSAFVIDPEREIRQRRWRAINGGEIVKPTASSQVTEVTAATDSYLAESEEY